MGKDIINILSGEEGTMEGIELEELKKKEEEIEGRIEKLEKIEKTLRIRVQRVERRLGLKSERMSPRKEEISLREIISQEERSIKKTTPKIGLGGRKMMLKKEMEGILKEHEAPSEEEREGGRARGKGGRKRLLRGEIERIVRGKEEKRGEKKQPPRKLKELKISTDQDARLLFEILLERGAIKLDEAKKQLGVDEETLEEWVEDLRGAGIIEVIKHPYGPPDLKLKSVDTVLEEKEE